MQVSRTYVQAFVNQLGALDARIKKLLQQQIAKRNLEQRIADGEADAYEDVSDIMQIAITGGADMASALATRYYNGLREASKPKTQYEARTSPTVDVVSVTRAAFAVAAEFARGATSKPLADLLADSATRFTHYAANETVRRNAAKDPGKPMYAILPGLGACEFCRMRAAAGEQYPDRVSVESHNNCTCAAVPVFNNAKIQGYDPQADKDAYKAARNAYRDGEYPDELKEKIAAARARHNAAYEAGEAARPWRETNAILMVWREMEKGEA